MRMSNKDTNSNVDIQVIRSLSLLHIQMDRCMVQVPRSSVSGYEFTDAMTVPRQELCWNERETQVLLSLNELDEWLL